MDNNPRLQSLINSYLNQSITDPERIELLDYFQNPDFFIEIEERMGREFDVQHDIYSMEVKYQSLLLHHVFHHQGARSIPAKKTKFWPWLATAAAMVAVVALAWFFTSKVDSRNVDKNQLVINNEILPGKNGATVTMSDGKVIHLSDSKNSIVLETQRMYYDDGSPIDSVAVESMKEVVVKTRNGQSYKFTLPDGSSVWLNASSVLTIPMDRFGEKQRTVALEGEAYFEIMKNKSLPFIVKSKAQHIEVLGTHFNVNAYKDEALVTTTLLEGSVRLVNNDSQHMLRPGEQAVNTGKSINIKTVDVNKAVDWINGDFNFEHTDFRIVMREIARWYDVDVIYDKSVPNDIRSGGWISRNTKLSVVLRAIEKSGQVHFKIDGRRIYVIK